MVAFDLKERFIDYAVKIIQVSELLSLSDCTRYISAQMLKSGTSPAAKYGEVQGAVSKEDVIQKLKKSLKELRETGVWLNIIMRVELIKPKEILIPLVEETEELISVLNANIDSMLGKKQQSKVVHGNSIDEEDYN